MTKDDRPIGLFDSGIGGLTVLRSLLTSLPSESFVYLGDTARLPYGSKSAQTIERYLTQNINYLETQNVKAIVVACNSASTVLLDSRLKFKLPVYNVIEPGAEAALLTSQTKRIGVLGTKATIAAHAYAKTLKRLDPSCEIYSQACPLLVPLVEEGWEDDPLTNLIIYRYVNPLLQGGQLGIDTMILGCTHYPALRGGIARVTGPNISLIDSSEAIAVKIKADFASGALAPGSGARKELKLLTTDVSPSFSDVASRLMKPHKIPALEAVDIG